MYVCVCVSKFRFPSPSFCNQSIQHQTDIVCSSAQCPESISHMGPIYSFIKCLLPPNYKSRSNIAAALQNTNPAHASHGAQFQPHDICIYRSVPPSVPSHITLHALTYVESKTVFPQKTPPAISLVCCCARPQYLFNIYLWIHS